MKKDKNIHFFATFLKKSVDKVAKKLFNIIKVAYKWICKKNRVARGIASMP